jgi:hypothetical protein
MYIYLYINTYKYESFKKNELGKVPLNPEACELLLELSNVMNAKGYATGSIVIIFGKCGIFLRISMTKAHGIWFTKT